MALEIIPLEINGKVINKVVENDTTVFTFLFYNKDGINITPARTVYTDEEEQISELSTQIAYGVYIEPYYEDGKYIFTFEYLNNVYKGIVSESDYENLTANSVLEFYNSTVDDRLLPEVTSADNGKVAKVVNGKWTAVDMSPLIVAYTISGVPSGNTYPLTANHTISEVAAAYATGKEVYAQISLGDTTATVPYFVRMMESGVLSTSINFVLNNTLYFGAISQIYDSSTETESSELVMIPINTSSMTFDDSTNTLAIIE